MPRPATQPGDRDFEEICPRVGYHSLIEKPVRAVAARFTRWREATVSEAQPSAQAGGAAKRENVGVHPERTLASLNSDIIILGRALCRARED